MHFKGITLKNDALLHQQNKSIDADELSRLNESLIISVSEQEVLDKLEDIRRHPSMYPYLFDKPIPTGPAENNFMTLSSLPGYSLRFQMAQSNILTLGCIQQW